MKLNNMAPTGWSSTCRQQPGYNGDPFLVGYNGDPFLVYKL